MKFVFQGTMSYITLDDKQRKFVNGEHYETDTDPELMKSLGFGVAEFSDEKSHKPEKPQKNVAQ